MTKDSYLIALYFHESEYNDLLEFVSSIPDRYDFKANITIDKHMTANSAMYRLLIYVEADKTVSLYLTDCSDASYSEYIEYRGDFTVLFITDLLHPVFNSFNTEYVKGNTNFDLHGFLYKSIFRARAHSMILLFKDKNENHHEINLFFNLYHKKELHAKRKENLSNFEDALEIIPIQSKMKVYDEETPRMDYSELEPLHNRLKFLFNLDKKVSIHEYITILKNNLRGVKDE